MKKSDAYKLGLTSAAEAAEYGDFSGKELETREAFVEAILEICGNKRQYAGHPGYDFNLLRNSENLWEAFERGEYAGASKASIGAARKNAAMLAAVHCGKG